MIESSYPTTKSVTLCDEEFILCPEKCMLFLKEEILFIADLHIGKTNHFRKAGIAVPNQIVFEEIQQVTALLEKYQPKTVVFLGDLFHSNHNASVDLLKQILDNEVHTRFILVEGNHDIMRKEIYLKMHIDVVASYSIGNIMFTHVPEDTGAKYNIHGHIHPAVVLNGQGRQYLRLPCFYFGKQKGILPAYGLFTGMHSLQDIKPTDQVYVVTEDSVMKMQ